VVVEPYRAIGETRASLGRSRWPLAAVVTQSFRKCSPQWLRQNFGAFFNGDDYSLPNLKDGIEASDKLLM